MEINEVINPMTVCKCIKDSQEKCEDNNKACIKCDSKTTSNQEDQNGDVCMCVCLSYFCLIFLSALR